VETDRRDGALCDARLDEGPIIHQDVARVTHRHASTIWCAKAAISRKPCWRKAVRWHLEARWLVYGRKTVVFD